MNNLSYETLAEHNFLVEQRVQATWRVRELLISLGCTIEADGLLRYSDTFFCPKNGVKFLTGGIL